jgi:hypothetical protein
MMDIWGSIVLCAGSVAAGFALCMRFSTDRQENLKLFRELHAARVKARSIVKALTPPVDIPTAKALAEQIIEAEGED